MPFQYPGNVKSLAREVEENKDRVNSTYLQLLGKEKYERLRDLSHTLLTPDCFFETFDQIMKKMKYGGAEMSSGTGSSSCNFLTNVTRLNPDCGIGMNGGKITVAFSLSEDSLKRGRSFLDTGRIISGYVHEFDHFVISSLQRHYLEIAHGIIGIHVGNVGNPKKLIRVIEEIGTADYSREDKEKAIALAGLACQYNTFCEQATRILDSNVLSSLGINRDMPWRNKDPSYAHMTVRHPAPDMTLDILVDGDPFKGISDAEAIDKMINWEDFFQPPCDSLYSKNLLNSLKKLQVNIVPFRDYIKNVRKKLRRRSEGK